MKESKRTMETIMTGMAFTFFVIISCYKLTNASLWFDETVEYWYSKSMFAVLPFEETSLSMYTRIVSTFQPPLYNVLMYVWLQVSDAEWWFRFFGVVMGWVGMLGIYQSIKKLGGPLAASIAVIFSSMIFKLLYYWQECAEYCLMLGTLCWAVYFWLCLFHEVNRKNMIFFTLACILPVYSQYGAVFPILAMLATAFLYVLSQKDKKSVLTICISYLCAFLCAALPLYFFFLKKQMLQQQGGSVKMKPVTYTNGFFRDFCGSFQTVLKWNLFSDYHDMAVKATTNA